MLPPDIDPQSRCRLPLVKREELDAEGQAVFDMHVNPKSGLIRGLMGPGGIRLHASRLSHLSTPVNRYMRFEATYDAHVREVAILITARECDSQFEWAAHEPQALKDGVPQETIDAIKFRKPTTGLDERDAAIVELGREMFGKRKVAPETYARALALFGKKQLVELTVLMGNYAGVAAMLCAFDMQLDDDATAILPV